MLCQTVISSDFQKNVMPLIEAAKKSIEIIVYDWRWYHDKVGSPCQLFNQTIVRAVRRGVKVRAIVNSQSVAKFLRQVGVDVKIVPTKRVIHCKIMVIDAKILITGSHNYSHSAFSSNYELSVILSDGVDVKPVLDFFNNLLSF